MAYNALVFISLSFVVLAMMRFDADHSATIRLHDEAAAIGFAILEFVRHLLLEIYDVVESFLLKIPDVEDARLRFRSHANGNEHLVALDARSLPDMIGGEARV